MMPLLEGANERRRQIRYERDLPVNLFDRQSRAIGADPDTVDVSLSGLGLQVSEQLKAGETVWFRVQLPGGPVAGKALVRWTRPHHLGYQCGLEIESLGFLHERRLKLYLDPDSFDLMKAVDAIVAAGAIVILYLIMAEHFHLPANPLAQVVDYIQLASMGP